MRRLSFVVAALVLIVATAGCATTISGRAVAPEGVSATGVTLSTDGYGVVLGTATSVAIDVFIEPQCPHCGTFFANFGDELRDHVTAGDLSVTIRPVTFLDFEDDYSARAANAIFLVAEQHNVTPELVFAFLEGLYGGLFGGALPGDDEMLAQVAEQAGLSSGTVSRIAAGEQAVDATAMSDANVEEMKQWGPAATPTVYDSVRDEVVDTGDPEWIAKLLDRN